MENLKEKIRKTQELQFGVNLPPKKELKTKKDFIEVSKFAEINRIEFEAMSDESFDSFLNGLKSTYESRIAAEKIAEEERVAKEKAEAEAREQQRIENERLKAEAEIQAKILADEKDAKAKLEAELKAKIEAEKIAEAEKKIAEERAKAEAEKLAKAPELEQLTIWVDIFSLPEISIENEKTELIKEKFEAFKKWAKKTINEN
jgi:membrane protein involved in colicin uptake